MREALMFGGSLICAWAGAAGLINEGVVLQAPAQDWLRSIVDARRAASNYGPIWVIDYLLLAVGAGRAGAPVYFAPETEAGERAGPFYEPEGAKRLVLWCLLWALAPFLVLLIAVDLAIDRSASARAERQRHRCFFVWVGIFGFGAAGAAFAAIDWPATAAQAG